MFLDPQYDYIYVNSKCEVVGRLLNEEYLTESEGLILGRCNTMAWAQRCAKQFAQRTSFEVKYSDFIDFEKAEKDFYDVASGKY